jgi:probable F420-dependent oxidoreductase
MGIRMGINTPIVVQVPGVSPSWEATAGIAEIAEIAKAADRLGFDHVTCSEHVGVPEGAHSPMTGGTRGVVYWDPLATLSYLAARTERIRLCTNVLVLGYHHPLAIAKRYGTLDRISGGRLVLGVGVGSMAEEFALLGASFADRGPRADDAIAALRAALSVREPCYAGPHHSFGGLVVEPHAVQERVPIWVGGRTGRAARRATTLADGWLPAALSAGELAARLERYPVPPGFEVVVGTAERIDPLGAPAAAEEVVVELAAAGATIVQPRLLSHSLAHYLEQVEAVAALSVFRRACTES